MALLKQLVDMILITNKCTERLHLARDIYWIWHSIQENVQVFFG